MTFAYWNPQALTQSHLLNAQTGAWTPVTSEKLGADVVDVRGQPRRAERYRIITGKNRIELWYAADSGDWLGCERRPMMAISSHIACRDGRQQRRGCESMSGVSFRRS
jgi:hypothetical protein